MKNLSSIIEHHVDREKLSNHNEFDRFLLKESNNNDLLTLRRVVKPIKVQCMALGESKEQIPWIYGMGCLMLYFSP